MSCDVDKYDCFHLHAETTIWILAVKWPKYIPVIIRNKETYYVCVSPQSVFISLSFIQYALKNKLNQIYLKELSKNKNF